MKNYNQFINNNLNEELIGSLVGGIKKLWKKGWEKYRKHKGVKEVEKIYKDVEQQILDELEEQKSAAIQKASAEKNERRLLNFTDFLNEANETKEDVDLSGILTPDTARQIVELLDKKMGIIVQNGVKRMDEVLRKNGGKEKNGLLHHLIQLKKSDLEMVYIENKINFLKSVGDEKTLKEAEIERKNKEKFLEAGYNKLDEFGSKGSEGDVEIGKIYQYKTGDGIKTIEITDEGEKEGEIKAKYITDKDGNVEEQTFQISNIIKDFNGSSGDKYKYLNTDSDIVDVEIIGDVESEEVPVKSVDSDNEFNVLIGRLRDKIE